MEIDILLKLLLSATLSAIVSLERQRSTKETFFQANLLVAMTSTLLTVLSANALQSGNSPGDPVRLATPLIIAVGVLGAGIIIQSRFTAEGLTQAATVAMVAALSITVGYGHYLLAFLATLLIVSLLTIFQLITEGMEKQKKIFAYVIKTEDKASLIIEIKKLVMEMGIKFIHSSLNKTRDGYIIEILFATSETKNKGFIERILEIDGVNEISNEKL
jgi:putative Mg2+ transporter-C (MgtC) family protein